MLVIYIIVSEEFANLALDQLSFSLIEFGRKYVLDPAQYIPRLKTTLFCAKKLDRPLAMGLKSTNMLIMTQK